MWKKVKLNEQETPNISSEISLSFENGCQSSQFGQILKSELYWRAKPIVHWSIGPFVHSSIGPLVHWLNFCQRVPPEFLRSFFTFPQGSTLNNASDNNPHKISRRVTFYQFLCSAHHPKCSSLSLGLHFYVEWINVSSASRVTDL